MVGKTSCISGRSNKYCTGVEICSRRGTDNHCTRDLPSIPKLDLVGWNTRIQKLDDRVHSLTLLVNLKRVRLFHLHKNVMLSRLTITNVSIQINQVLNVLLFSSRLKNSSFQGPKKVFFRLTAPNQNGLTFFSRGFVPEKFCVVGFALGLL